MKKLLYLVFLASFFSCDQTQSINSKGKDALTKSKYHKLFAQYFNIAIDTLWVYSPDTDSSAYNGRAIDSINALFFPSDMAQQHFIEPPSLFAIYKFAIDSNRLALITRTPSDYVPSSVKLFFYDKRKDSLTSFIEIGETIGDAGDYMVKNTWLFRDTISKHILALIDVTQGHDNSVENPKDTTISETDYYTLLDLSKEKIDTLFDDKENLPRQYQNMVRKKAKIR
ncbi:MAG TPA: hypothetical protein VF008_17780 [Niastella sp.]